MSSQLPNAIDDLALALAPTGVRVWTYVPESVNGPAIILQPGDPFVSTTQDTTYGTWQVNFLASCLVEIGTNERMTDDLLSLLGDTLASLVTAGYGVDSISAPYAFSYNSVNYLAANVAVVDQVSF